MNEPTIPRNPDPDLTALFQRSREGEVWPEPANAASMIWWRARAAELVRREIEERDRLARPLAAARKLAALAALAAVELGIFQAGATLLESFPDLRNVLAEAGFTPLTAAILALTIPPTLALLHRFRRLAEEV